VDQGQFSDPDFISGTHQRENVQLPIKICHQTHLTGPSNIARELDMCLDSNLFETGG
jgi:hypothetical protein